MADTDTMTDGAVRLQVAGLPPVLFGAVASPSHAVAGYRSPIVQLRRELDLFANIRPVLGPNADLVVVRENTEGLYAGRERLEDDGATAIAERVITRRASERIVRAACELAVARGAASGRQPRVTIVHKANVLRVSDGLFREVALATAAQYPVSIDELLVDVAAMHIAQRPQRFDVVVTTNLFGDILSDVACIHGGGLGLAASSNLGTAHALFEPVHGAAPDIVGRGIANPLAAISCVALLIEWAGSNGRLSAAACGGRAPTEVARDLNAAVAAVVRDGPHTPDLGGNASTAEVVERITAQAIS